MTVELQTLVRYRMEQASSALRAAEALLHAELWRDAINRAYYATFYAGLAKRIGVSKALPQRVFRRS
jgi:uncharacterized protein (UPF0332 family)